jgi:hypothetical protein
LKKGKNERKKEKRRNRVCMTEEHNLAAKIEKRGERGRGRESSEIGRERERERSSRGREEGGRS